MGNDAVLNNDRKMTSIFERFLSLWVVLCIVAGILLGKIQLHHLRVRIVKSRKPGQWCPENVCQYSDFH